MNNSLTRFTKLILDIMFFSGILVVITLPLSLKMIGISYYTSVRDHFFFMVVVLGASGILGILIIGQLRKMMRTVLGESCFVYENVRSLNRMAMFSFGISIMFLIKLFVLPTMATVVIILVFFIAALFSEVLAQVFERAVKYKEENDLTI